SMRAVRACARIFLGRALTDLLTAAGTNVLGVDLDADGLAAAAADTGCATRVADVSSAVENESVVAEAIDRFGGLDMSFLNAGILDRDPAVQTYTAAELDLERYATTRAVNLDGVVYGAVAAAKAMAQADGGSIVATASVAGLVGYPPTPFYAATKAGVVGLVVSLGAAFAAQGVRINAICPGGVATPLVGLDPEAAAAVVSLLAPVDLAAEMIATAESDAAGQVFSVVAGREPVRQLHPLAEVPGFG
ncbi:MAG: SDR family oxidoreductase, partial [Actinomycetota bacterium]